VVDDSLFLRKRLRQTLEPEYAMIEANNGLAALDQIATQEFDCILTDLLMPDMDGFGLLAEIARRKILTPVVVVTADIQKTTRERCKELGASALVQKPVDAEVLRSVLLSVLRG